MIKMNRFTISTGFLILMLCFSLVNARPAFADDAAPPADTPAAVEETQTTDPDTETTATVPPTEETEGIPPTEEAEILLLPTNESEATLLAEEVESTETEFAALIQELPESTSVVVLNENGEVVPLATQEAAEIIALPDPQFCPTRSLPGDAACGPVRTTIQAAVNDAKAAGVAGTVYIQSGTYNETVTIADFSTALTLQGVFSLAPYTTITNPADRPVLNGRIFLIDGPDTGPGTANTANITLIDLIINNNDTTGGDDPAIVANGNTADITLIRLDINGSTNGNSGLQIINHSGSVFLTGVDASDTDNIGAIINNTAGTGAVTITDSVFNQNDDNGLQVTSRGPITLVNVTANGNNGDGAQLDNDELGSTANIEVIKSVFSNNVGGGDGLVAVSNGNITLINVTAQNNQGDGVNLSFPNAGTHTATICGGVFSGHSGGGISTSRSLTVIYEIQTSRLMPLGAPARAGIRILAITRTPMPTRSQISGTMTMTTMVYLITLMPVPWEPVLEQTPMATAARIPKTQTMTTTVCRITLMPVPWGQYWNRHRWRRLQGYRRHRR